MILGPDIVLIGAGFSPHTRQIRRQKRLTRPGPSRRNRWIGPIQVRASLRVGVDRDFVKKYYEQLVSAIEDGVLLVEYKLDRYVDPEELKILAFGSEEERAAYEQKASEEIEEKAQEYEQAKEQLANEVFEARRASVLGRMPVQKPGATDLPEGQAGGTLDGSEPDPNDPNTDEVTHDYVAIDYDGEKEGVKATNAPATSIAGSREEVMTTARDVQQDQLTNEEPDYNPDGSPSAGNAEPIPEGEYKPLPDGWRSATKAELLAYCEERGIDTSDTPSNKELRRRLDEYVSRGG